MIYINMLLISCLYSYVEGNQIECRMNKIQSILINLTFKLIKTHKIRLFTSLSQQIIRVNYDLSFHMYFQPIASQRHQFAMENQ